MSVSVFNRCWSKVILETLVRQGVSHFCIAPGSRSTPLTLEAVRLQNASRATCHSHFDERGLGFFALGIAKSTQAPVAVIVTSGTAAANLYPAIIEARQTGVNLIILTADLNCGNVVRIKRSCNKICLLITQWQVSIYRNLKPIMRQNG